MDDLVKQRLENQAFMASVVGSGTPGLTVAEWIELLVAKVGGFIGDVLIGPEAEPVRTVVALSEPPFPEVSEGSDLVPSVMGALNHRLSTIRDASVAETLGGMAAMLRRLYSAGGTLECSMAGNGFALDFVRGRHMVSGGGRLLAMHVHGRTVLGSYYDPGSAVVAVHPDGSCELENGGNRPFAQVSDEESGVATEEIAVPSRPTMPKTPLADRIMKSRAGSLEGPVPAGMLVTRGEDGKAMLVLKSQAEPGKLSVRFLPTAVQVLVDDKVSAQSGFDDLGSVLEWLEDGSIEVCRISEGGMDWTKAPVVIRASA